jgi:hypothetical protein
LEQQPSQPLVGLQAAELRLYLLVIFKLQAVVAVDLT